jgi:RNA polymerase Rpb4
VQPRPWIEYAVLNYLRPLVGTRTEEDVRSFWAVMSKHPALRNLTRAERLHIVNLRPHSDAAVYPLIEDCERRFDEAQVAEVVALVLEHLGEDSWQEEQEEDQGEGEEDEEEAEFMG